MTLELSVEGDRMVLRARGLWSEPRVRGRRLNVNVDGAEK